MPAWNIPVLSLIDNLHYFQKGHRVMLLLYEDCEVGVPLQYFRYTDKRKLRQK